MTRLMKRLFSLIAAFHMAFVSLAMEGEPIVCDTVMLDECNVLAIKHHDKLFDQPVAATLVTGAELRQLNVLSMKGISDVVPNFFMPDYGSRVTSSIYVRGIGARIDQPAVGLVVDNVPYLNKNAYDFDIADISAIEMLRGPQSTLYGRNTMGGLINVSTLSPFRSHGIRITVETGNHSVARVRAGMSRMLGSSFGFAISGNFNRRLGEHRNQFSGQRVDDETSGGGRLKLEWRPSSSVKISNSASFSLLRQTGYPYEFVETGRIDYNDPTFYHRFTFSDGLTVNAGLGDVNLTSITSVQHINDNLTLDQDFLPLPYFTLTQKQLETGFTQDIVVKSTGSDSPYRWLAGAFGFYKHMRMPAPVTFKDTGIAELIEKHRNESNPGYPIKWDSREFTLNSEFILPTWGLALYHESGLKLGKFNLTASLRLDYERSMMDYHSFCTTGYTIYHPADEPYRHVDIDINDRGHLSRQHLSLIPKVGAVYEFGALGNLYASVSKGFKSGGYNTQMFSDVLQQRLMGVMGIGSKYDVDDVVGYRPEKSWNYEMGSHLRFDFGLDAEMSVFYIYCLDQQLTVFPEGTVTGRMMTNAGRTRSVGGELTLRWTLSANLSLSGSYGFTDARFTRYHNGRADFSGKRVPYVPENTLFLQSLYTYGIKGKAVKAIVLDVNLRGTGNICWNEQNDLRQPFYFLLGAGVSVEMERIQVSVWGRNLTDAKYSTFYFQSMGNSFLQRGKGMEGGVSVSLMMP